MNRSPAIGAEKKIIVKIKVKKQEKFKINEGGLILYNFFTKGAFNNYVDKMRGGGGQKMSVFVHAQGIKTVHEGGWGQKMAKFCPRSC